MSSRIGYSLYLIDTHLPVPSFDKLSPALIRGTVFDPIRVIWTCGSTVRSTKIIGIIHAWYANDLMSAHTPEKQIDMTPAVLGPGLSYDSLTSRSESVA